MIEGFDTQKKENDFPRITKLTSGWNRNFDSYYNVFSTTLLSLPLV